MNEQIDSNFLVVQKNSVLSLWPKNDQKIGSGYRSAGGDTVRIKCWVYNFNSTGVISIIWHWECSV